MKHGSKKLLAYLMVGAMLLMLSASAIAIAESDSGSTGDPITFDVGDSDNAQLGDSGDNAQLGDSGDNAQLGDSGDNAQLGDSGDNAQLDDGGDNAQLDDGDNAQLDDDGDNAQLDDSDNAQLDDSGDNAQLDDGDNAQLDDDGEPAELDDADAAEESEAAEIFSVTILTFEFETAYVAQVEDGGFINWDEIGELDLSIPEGNTMIGWLDYSTGEIFDADSAIVADVILYPLVKADYLTVDFTSLETGEVEYTQEIEFESTVDWWAVNAVGTRYGVDSDHYMTGWADRETGEAFDPFTRIIRNMALVPLIAERPVFRVNFYLETPEVSISGSGLKVSVTIVEEYSNGGTKQHNESVSGSFTLGSSGSGTFAVGAYKVYAESADGMLVAYKVTDWPR